ncbi:MAG: hypothetical protein WDZ82_00095 [Candidatus Paceibacterota bacterium]
MPKKDMQDVVPPERRSIRNVPLPKHKEKDAETPHYGSGTTDETSSAPTPGTQPENEGEKYAVRQPIRSRPRRHVPMWGIWLVTIISLLVVVFAASTLFTSANIIVTPKQETHEASLPLSAGPDGDISFETVSISTDASTKVSISGTGEVSEEAVGELTLYNEYTTSEFPLMVNTRFESSDGNIYHITEAVRIPGMTENEEDTLPGQITVRVRASEPGEEYNLTEGELTVPGLVGDPSYEDVYAMVSSPITGGFVGERGIVNDDDKNRAEDELRVLLEEEATASIQSQIPDRFILYPETITISFGPTQQKSTDGGEATLEQEATVRAVMFPREELEQFLAETLLSDEEDPSAIHVNNLNDLSFTPNNNYSPQQSTVNGTLSGSAVFVWNIDEDAIKDSISGRDKGRLKSALSRFSEIEEASASVQPFWLMSFPSDHDDITISIQLDSEVVNEEDTEPTPES